MKKRKMLLISLIIKFSTILLCFLLFLGHYLIGRIWFNPTASVSEIKSALRDAHIEEVNAYNKDGFTGLMLAAGDANVDLVKAFLDAGADINARAKNKVADTALHIACYNVGDFALGNKGFETIKLLVERGAQTRIPNNRQEQPIHHIMQVDNNELNLRLIELFVKHGADVNAQDNTGTTILHLGVNNNNIPWTSGFLERFGSLVDLTRKNKKGMTPLEYADYLGFRDLAEIIRKGPKIIDDITSRDPNGLTGLMLATISGNQKRTESLIRRGADLNAQSKDEYKQTALHFALMHQQIAMVEVLVNNGADINKANATGDLPLHFIMRLIKSADRNRAFDILSDKGANLNAQNKNGETLLHLAVRQDDYSLIEKMVRDYGFKIDATIRNKENMTALDLARKLERKSITPILEGMGEISFLPGLAPVAR